MHSCVLNKTPLRILLALESMFFCLFTRRPCPNWTRPSRVKMKFWSVVQTLRNECKNYLNFSNYFPLLSRRECNECHLAPFVTSLSAARPVHTKPNFNVSKRDTTHRTLSFEKLTKENQTINYLQERFVRALLLFPFVECENCLPSNY